MQVNDLFFADDLSYKLTGFIANYTSPVEILNNFHTLMEDVKGQTIKGTVQDGAIIQGDVFIDEGSVVHAGVVIEGPVYIGKNVSVRPHANLRKGCYLDDEVVIGHGADIKNALLMRGAKVQDGTFCGDSVVGRGGRVGSGTILANRKFNQTNIKIDLDGVQDSGRDFFGAILGDYSRLAANVVTSPGTVVGAYTWVGSGVVLNGTIPPDTLVTVKQELETRTKDRVDLKSGIGEYEHL